MTDHIRAALERHRSQTRSDLESTRRSLAIARETVTRMEAEVATLTEKVEAFTAELLERTPPAERGEDGRWLCCRGKSGDLLEPHEHLSWCVHYGTAPKGPVKINGSWTCCGGPHCARPENPRGHAVTCEHYGEGTDAERAIFGGGAGAGLPERKAGADIAAAQLNLQTALTDPGTTALQREQAQLQVDEAERAAAARALQAQQILGI